MTWKTGFSWTKSHDEMDENAKEMVHVHAGPFYFYKGKRIEGYAGFRPTAPNVSGGNEGLFVPFKRLMQRLGMSNLGFALRRAK